MKFYIGTKLENHPEHNRLRDALAVYGHTCTYDLTTHGPVHSSGMERIREVAQLELQGVLDADVVFILWPGGRGTHVELGAALAAKKDVILITDQDGHYIPCPDICAFYAHPLVRITRTIEDATRYAQYLLGGILDRHHAGQLPEDPAIFEPVVGETEETNNNDIT